MKILRFAAVVALLFVAAPAFAQWQTPNHSVPLGRGGGIQGFGNALPGVAGQPLVSTGPTTDPAFGNIANSGFAAGAADTYKGSLNGSSVIDVPRAPCTAVNQALRYTAGVGESCGSISVTTGYDMPINMGLSASAVGGALTLNVTTASGAAPTTSVPVLVPFRSTTATLGTVTWGTISSALSITIPSGATLGTTNGVPFRIWEFIDYNGGTPAIGVATCSTPTNIFACASWESTLKTSITISGSATAAGTLYATAGVNLDAVRIIGYCEYGSGLTAAGTWASSCTTLQTFGPGVPKPGDLVQASAPNLSAVTAVTFTTSVTATNVTASITPTSAINLIRYFVQTTFANSSDGSTQVAQLYRGSTAIGALNKTSPGANAGATQAAFMGYDAPFTTSATTYVIKGGASLAGGTGSIPATTGEPATEVLEEIQGALDPPANDNINPGIFSQTG